MSVSCLCYLFVAATTVIQVLLETRNTLNKKKNNKFKNQIMFKMHLVLYMYE